MTILPFSCAGDTPPVLKHPIPLTLKHFPAITNFGAWAIAGHRQNYSNQLRFHMFWQRHFMANPLPSCGVCKAGFLVRKSTYRMSSMVVLIGYILLVPSLIGIAISLLIMLGVGSAATQIPALKQQVTQNMQNAGVPAAIMDKVIKGEVIGFTELLVLPENQQNVVRSSQGKLAGAGLGTVLGGGASICLGIASLIGGLGGWLLVMKKKVLQCNVCGAVIAAS